MNLSKLSKEERNKLLTRNKCMDCGKLIDLAAHNWYRERKPDDIPRRCSYCAFDALLEMTK